jgi:probable blue pigment (indigoidine) exporter
MRVGRVDWKGLGLGILFATMWSSAFSSSRIVVQYWPPFLLLSVRFVISGLIALGIGFVLGQRIRLTAQEWRLVAVFGLCQNALYLGLFHYAMQTVEAGVAAIIASAMPLVVAALGRAFMGQRLRPLALAGLLAGFAGVLVIMAARLGHGLDLRGTAVCMIGVTALAVATLTLRGAAAGGNLWIVVGLQMLVGSAVLLPASLALETWTVSSPPRFLAALAYSILISGVAATMIWFILVRRIGATRAATFHFLNPFLGVAIAAMILGEHVTARDFIGVLIIMAGILAVQVSGARAASAPEKA